jgi:hypothetical protein
MIDVSMFVCLFHSIEHIAQMVNQQMSTGTSSHESEQTNNQNLDQSQSILRSTFVVPNDSGTSAARLNEGLRSRSADSRPINPNPATATATATATSNMEDDDSDWIDLPMDHPAPSQALPAPSILPMPRIRGSAIIRRFSRMFSLVCHSIHLLESIDRSLPCTSPYFTQALHPPFDNPNNATNITPNEAAALNNAAGRTVLIASGSQRPRGRHRHPAGPWAQQNQNFQMPTSQMQNFMFTAPGVSPSVTGVTAAGQPYNMTAHSFEIPMMTQTLSNGMPGQQGQMVDTSLVERYASCSSCSMYSRMLLSLKCFHRFYLVYCEMATAEFDVCVNGYLPR